MTTKQNPFLRRTSILSPTTDGTGIKSLAAMTADFNSIKIAWPNLPAIRLDVAFAYLDAIDGVHYALFPPQGDEVGAQIVITPNAELARQAKRDDSLRGSAVLLPRSETGAESSEYLSRSVSNAMLRSMAAMGWTEDVVVSVLSWMRQFGIGDRTPRYWRKYRQRDIVTLSPLEERVAEILKPVILAEVFSRKEPNIKGFVQLQEVA